MPSQMDTDRSIYKWKGKDRGRAGKADTEVPNLSRKWAALIQRRNTKTGGKEGH